MGKSSRSAIAFLGVLILAAWLLPHAGRVAGEQRAPHDLIPVAVVAASLQSAPVVAYNATEGEYLVVWLDEREGAAKVYGQRIAADGTLLDGNFAVGDGAEDVPSAYRPRLVWNSTDNEYLVAWASPDGGGIFYGQRVAKDGALVGDRLTLAGGGYVTDGLDIAYLAQSNRYFVVWAERRFGATLEPFVLARIFSNEGTPVTDEFFACPQGECASSFQRRPAVAYNSTNNEVLVVWQDVSPTSLSIDIAGRRISAGGTLLGGKVDVAVAANSQTIPAVTYNPNVNQYLVVWRDGRNDPDRWQLWHQFLSANGMPSGVNLAVSLALADQQHPAVSASTTSVGFGAVWADARAYGNGDRYTANHDITARLNYAGSGWYFDETILATDNGADWPDLAYDPIHNRYLVVWQDARNDANGEAGGWEELDIYADFLSVGPAATPTATATGDTPTPTASPTFTPTVTPTPTASPTTTSTPTPTESPTATPTATLTATPTTTSTASPTATATVTPTATASGTSTPTLTITPTASPTLPPFVPRIYMPLIRRP